MPEVSWQRGLNPRPPDQPAPFLLWQLALPSHLCPEHRPLPFLRKPGPSLPHSQNLEQADTQGVSRPTGPRASRVNKSSGSKIPPGSCAQAGFLEGGQVGKGGRGRQDGEGLWARG